MTIEREPLRQAVRRALFKRVLDRALHSGAPINELELAEELGVSRTPLREALIALECEGIVSSNPGKGFHVVPLEAETARELYELVAHLEMLALQRSEPPSAEQLDELHGLNSERARALDEPERLVDIDTTWHRTLLVGCANRQLQRVLELVKVQLYRYEYAYMTSEERARAGTEDHEAILEALREDRREDAVELLARHWERGLGEALNSLGKADRRPQRSA